MTAPRTALRSAFGLSAAALIALPLLTSCSVVEVTPIERDTDGAISQEGQADVFELRVGDCLNLTSADVIYSVPVVPCSEEHEQEVYTEFEIDSAVFPGDDAIEREGDERCTAAFADFVGVDYFDSELDLQYLTPSQDGWEFEGDKLVSCVVYDPAGPVTGSLAGAAR